MALYCASCGKQLNEDARFCSSCGRPVGSPPVEACGHPPGLVPSLIRPRKGRKIAGVCQGLANRMGWDITLLRIIFVILGIITFPIWIVVYLIGWLVMPNEPVAPVPPDYSYINPTA